MGPDHNIGIVGWACRLPGANSIPSVWSLLTEERCAIKTVPPDRFGLDHYFHPRKQERGRSYTWAAGVLDDVFGFDPTPFGISPREAAQLDPQQRILLQLTWEALEDAGIKPSSIAGTEVGVYVGASLTEYSHSFLTDTSVGDAHFATGNALAVIANRISYIFDLTGPSLTIDTACSSSLVALHHACEALRSGRIDTAVVGGINIIAAPTSFISFSQASMLSPTGLCRAFSADADGFVRAEGGAVLVLRRAADADSEGVPLRGRIIASDVNSDGRTNGISLPSGEAQEALLRRVYGKAGVTPDQLAFVEAHGTGTPAGDPIEAGAIGRFLGKGRSEQPLPIGSIKTNIGHLESASGLAGLIKALLSLQHGVLPRSLNFNKPNPHIPFAEHKLAVAEKPVQLTNPDQIYAGVNSFGFGGTNAHVILTAGGAGTTAATPSRPRNSDAAKVFSISAHTRPALAALAERYRDLLGAMPDQDIEPVASSIAHRRDMLSSRLVVTSTNRQTVIDALNAAEKERDHPTLILGNAAAAARPVAFVYSGNGSQWAGMGRNSYKHNKDFRDRFAAVDALFEPLSGWSLIAALHDDTLEQRLDQTSVAQPLIFAIQVAATAALRALGLRPMAVLGHSVGEVAAAEASGAIDLSNAVKLVFRRSMNQERVRNMGRMAAVLATEEVVTQLLKSVDQVEIAAYNNPNAQTVSGPATQLAQFMQMAKSQGIACLDLDLDYPFHTSLMAGIHEPLLADLASLEAHDSDIAFVSGVTGDKIDGRALTGEYWWHNVREPVRFSSAVRSAAQLGARVFVEIGPRSVLSKHIIGSLDGQVSDHAYLCAIDRGNDQTIDPMVVAAAKALSIGAEMNVAALIGGNPVEAIKLPSYPWQQTMYRFPHTVEMVGWDVQLKHPLSGARFSSEIPEWRAYVDSDLVPDLAGHQVGEQVILPGTGFIEISLSVIREWLKTDDIRICDTEILRPLDLTGGETREIVTRISAISQTFEIFSRPRLSNATLVLHCRGKFFHGARIAPPVLNWPKMGEAINRDQHYRVAAACGLHYQHGFAEVERLLIHNREQVSVLLTEKAGTSKYLIDPMRLDCCAQGIVALFPQLKAEERGVAYVPVRVDEIIPLVFNAIPHRALITVRSANERSIYADFTILDADANMIAILRGVRCQTAPLRRPLQLEASALLEIPSLHPGALIGEVGVAAGVDSVFKAASTLTGGGARQSEDARQLLDGWATMAAYEIAAALSTGGKLDIDLVISRRRWPEAFQSWLLRMLANLQAAGLASESDGAWTLVDDPLLPSATSIIQALANEHPEHAGEILAAAEISGLAKRLSDPDARLDGVELLSTQAHDFFELSTSSLAGLDETLRRLLLSIDGIWDNSRSIRVLHVGYSVQATQLASLAGADVTIYEPDRRKLEKATNARIRSARVHLVGEFPADAQQYDLVVVAGRLNALPAGIGLNELAVVLAPRGMLIGLQGGPSLVGEMIGGLVPAADAESVKYPSAASRNTTEWKAALDVAGFIESDARALAGRNDGTILLAAKVSAHAAPAAATGEQRPAVTPVVIIVKTLGDHKAGLAKAIANSLNTADHPVLASIGSLNNPVPNFDPDKQPIVHVLGSDSDEADHVETLGRKCLELKAIAEHFAPSSAHIWLITEGALSHGKNQVDPVTTGVWAFARTLANEFPTLDIRKADIAPDCDEGVAAQRLAAILRSGTSETELRIDQSKVSAVRVEGIGESIGHGKKGATAAVRLERNLTVPQRLSWVPVERRRPASGEVEIAVTASGLNFRDLMYMMGLLPDDILEDGLTGPTLGLECAGTISAVGRGVTGFAVGDRVAAFSSSSFSSHVTLPISQIAKLPEGVSLEAGATIPVAFLTAWYSLVTVAQLEADEWVLIHGGAGAVGMAAIQIAKLHDAKIIATAGSPGKRELLASLGVDHVLDSRSLQFSDEVHAITGTGVNVVLNSLSNEAMERSIACLAPFGRFVELGKRDYVSNTQIGLRPFRKNLSYFGVDVDQLMSGRPKLARRIFTDIMEQFSQRKLAPLPYSLFSGEDVVDAFQLMQRSGHIGKIVISPAALESVRSPSVPFEFDARGTHLITGAFGGFGMATARWLADKGVTNLVLIGRQGAANLEARTLVEELTGRGVKVMAEACDVSDQLSVDLLFAKIRSNMPRLSGVIHSAMVLDDAIIANLDAARIEKVLTPKVKGAINLDRATRNMHLEYFILYSSVTTLIGNPGQGSYVAANAYMEGLARQRRRDGHPALAIGWGPIADVGVVARSEKLQGNLQRLGGVHGMRARDGLDLMAQVLSEVKDNQALAVVTIAHYEGVFSADRLPILKSPTYAALVSASRSDVDGAAQIDLRALLANEELSVVRERVVEVVTANLASVLHFSAEDINQSRPLGEMGLDSLMALELVMSLEACFGIKFALTISAGELTVLRLAEEIIAQAGGQGASKDATMATQLIEKHFGNLETGSASAMVEIMENEGLISKNSVVRVD